MITREAEKTYWTIIF